MSLIEYAEVVTDGTNGDKTWDPAHVLGGVLEVTSNSSSGTVKTFPAYSSLIGSDRVVRLEAIDLLIVNRGSADFSLAANSGSIADFLLGDTVVPAGEFRRVKLVLTYSGTPVLGIFVGA